MFYIFFFAFFVLFFQFFVVFSFILVSISVVFFFFFFVQLRFLSDNFLHKLLDLCKLIFFFIYFFLLRNGYTIKIVRFHVPVAILVFHDNETVAVLVFQTTTVGSELNPFLTQALSFAPVN